ncbi:MAG: hypothetical protein M3Q30_19390 [Actinomycetota bacterium]|nr:hypothetical protein [Actinomycetota bacterium]
MLIGVVCAAFLAGMVAHGLVGGAVTPRAEHSVGSNAGGDPSGRGSPGPARYSHGIPAGFARSKDGARTAAAAYVLTGQVLIDLPPTAVDAAVRLMSSAGSADVQVSTTEQQLEQLRAVLAPGTGLTRYLQAVVATRVDAFTPDRARVSLWNVGVLSRIGVAAPQAGWTTSTFDLVWERGDWKVWSETISPGPAPALNGGAAPATSDELEAKLEGFTPWEQSP